MMLGRNQISNGVDKTTKKYVFVILGGLFCLNVLAWLVVWELSRPRLLEINFFDIGQGDSIFIKTPQNRQILIDGGPSGEVILEKLGKEMPFWDRTIDLVILTHPEYDHTAGLIEVLKRYRVKNILWTGVVRDTAEYKEWQRLIEEEDTDIHIARAGQKIKINGSRFIEVLHPFESLEGREFKDANNTSIIARLVFDETAFLFTGDAYRSVEKELLERGTEVGSDVLKVGHHGSKTSSALEFIKVVSPKIAVISCGRDNRYGHPHPETLETLAKYDINILRTDEIGDIKIISDGKSYGVSDFQN